MGNLVVTTSWDDGSKLDLRLAKLLDKHDIKATFYIPTEFLDDALKLEDLKEIAKVHEIGAHTFHHVDLTSVSLSRAKEEIEKNKIYLENNVDQKIRIFCYPRGKYNAAIKEVVKNTAFVAARTVNYGGFNSIIDPFEWQVTLAASDSSPRQVFGIWLKSRISTRSLLDWEIRAKLLFDLALQKGGIYHIWGHSWEFERKQEWDKLDRVFSYISMRPGVKYMSNGDIFVADNSPIKLNGNNNE